MFKIEKVEQIGNELLLRQWPAVSALCCWL